MTAAVEASVVRQTWPAWQVPAAALPQWVALVAALLELGQEPWCANDAEKWWSRRPEDVDDAVAVCRLCPVMDACRSFAVAAGEREGVWGGLTPADRGAERAVSR